MKLDHNECVVLQLTLIGVEENNFYNKLVESIVVVVLTLDENWDQVELQEKSHQHCRQTSDNVYHSQYIENVFHYSDW
jgi:hypothetical protein